MDFRSILIISFLTLFTSQTVVIAEQFGEIGSGINRIEALELSEAVYGKRLPPAGWKMIREREEANGLKWAVYERDDGQRVLSFAGTRGGPFERVFYQDWSTNLFKSGLLGDPVAFVDWATKVFKSDKSSPSYQAGGQYEVALGIAEDQIHEIKYSHISKPLIVVGHSKAGGISQFVGAMTRLMAWGFNSAPLGGELLNRISPENKEWANKGNIQLTNFFEDPVHQLDKLPRSESVGKVTNLPMPDEIKEAYKDSLKSWNDFERVGAMFEYHINYGHNGLDLLKTSIKKYESNTALIRSSYSKQSDPLKQQNRNFSDTHTNGSRARNSNREVIFGYGPDAQKKYDSTVQKLGSKNVKWVHSIPSTSERRNIARAFNADTISTIRHESYREITRAGVTTREPIKAVSYKPAEIPDQTTHVGIGPPNHSSSPPNYSESLNVSRGFPTQRSTFNPQGATTDRSNITWDDKEWPFMPIFGLLYPNQAQNSETIGD